MQPTYVTKNLTASASTGVATISSGLTVALVGSTLDTARRLIVWGSTSVAGAGAITLTGLSETGTPISETVTGSTIGTAVETTQDFKRLTGVTFATTAGIASTGAYVGTSSRGGTPWNIVDNTKNPISVGFLLTPTTTAILISFEYTADYPSYNTAAGVWNNSNTTVGPVPIISSLGSSVAANTYGTLSAPIAAWRITLTSSSSGAGTANATVMQSG